MIFDLELIKSITMGAESIVSDNGVFKFLRFTGDELKTTDNINLLYTSGVQMEFETDGTVLNMSVNTKKNPEGSRSCFAFDVFVNGEFSGSIKNFDDALCVGSFAGKEYELGSFKGEFSLGDGKKKVRIVFPHSTIGEIEKIEVTDATFVLPIKRDKTIVAYGDSITQGYDALHPVNTYTMRLADYFDAELFNKGLGGEKFPPEMAKVKNNKTPEFVTVAYGTNDWWSSNRETVKKDADEFLFNLEKNYPDIPVFVITPIWRKDFESVTEFGKFSEMDTLIKDICKKYKNVRVISGFDLVPHDENCFGDLRLHPNDKGFEHYFKNLAKQIN